MLHKLFQRATALAFLGLATIAIACWVAAAAGANSLAPYALGFTFWAVAAGVFHTVTGRRMSRVLYALAVVGAPAAVLGLAFLAVGLDSAAMAS